MKKVMFFAIYSLLACSQTFAQPQANGREYKVALFVPSGAELLDFTGPGEAFTQAHGFKVYLVSLSEESIKSQGFMDITPNYSFKNCPAPDIILIPGGGTGRIINDPEAIQWIKGHYEKGGTVLSVCTGAAVAAKAGLLEGKKATTYHSSFDYVRGFCQDCELLEGVRYVDNGRIITTAGISAGIDGALHLISRIKGQDIAEQAARNMEYDKWAPREGYMNYENAFVRYFRENGPAKAKAKFEEELKNPEGLFFVGEMKNLAAELAEAGEAEKAAAALEFCAGYYPGEIILFNQLREIYSQLGRPAPPAPEAFTELAMNGKVEEAAALFHKAKAQFPNWAFFEESRMNWAGYQLLYQNKTEAAIGTFQLNAEAYPESFNVYDSLGEAYMKDEQWEKSREFYNKSLKLNPENDNARKMLAKMEER
ncbi:MAG: DJ-1/PfpI family protein [Lewinellaceae bacterium]|nr:DJ-1/PfpI family protein [Lewinellaceae bacterium]MCB9289028.1 DJ-1/PfpI family protein [Lewinellaceae bacterium]